MKKLLIILTGPTAVGKTEISLQLAKALNGEIISADSMQVYKGMDIGTAKISLEERQGIKHYLIDEIEPFEDFNVQIFQAKAKEALAEIYEKGKVPIVVGGTGFYIQALLYDVDFSKGTQNEAYRQELEDIRSKKGKEYLHAMLEKVDTESARAIHFNNVKKVMRALEFYHVEGEPISTHNKRERGKESPYTYAYFVLNDERNILYERINQRVDSIIAEGLVSEVEDLKEKGLSRHLVSMQGLGYKEIYAYLEGECSLEEAIYTLKRDTRHFAKRQITWFKREKNVIWVDKSKLESDKACLDYILEFARKNN